MDKKICKSHQFVIDDKKVMVYPGVDSDRPVVYLNTFAEEGSHVYKELHNAVCPDFTLVAISRLEWDYDMAPWDIPPISKGDTPCTGGADEYLPDYLPRILFIRQGFLQELQVCPASYGFRDLRNLYFRMK